MNVGELQVTDDDKSSSDVGAITSYLLLHGVFFHLIFAFMQRYIIYLNSE